VIVVVCAQDGYPPGGPPAREYVWSTVYPASQNLILAARGLGLGSVFTTFNLACEPALREILALPDDVFMGTVIPMGYPARPFGPVRRRPVEEVIHHDRWNDRRNASG
jgi:nitroreductase